VEWWNDGILEDWKKDWNVGKLERWNDELLEMWNNGIVEY
jgi:hypothetical protein